MDEFASDDRPRRGLPAQKRGWNDAEADQWDLPSLEPVEEGLNLRELVAILQGNAGLVFLMTLVTAALAAFFAFTADPQYRARASLRFQDERRMMTGGIESAAIDAVAGAKTDPLLSQAELVRSRSVLGEVVDMEGLRLTILDRALSLADFDQIHVASDAPIDSFTIAGDEQGYSIRSANGKAVRAQRGQPIELGGISFTLRTAPEEPVQFTIIGRDRAIDLLADRLRVATRERTDIMDLEFTAANPVVAQKVVNSTAQVFRERSQESAKQQSRRRLEFVTARLVETDAALAQAQQALSDFQTRQQAFSSSEQFAIQQGHLNTLDMRKQELEAERRIYSGLLDRIARNQRLLTTELRTFVSSPNVANNPVVIQWYNQLARNEVVRDSMRAARTPETNPDFVRNNARLEQAQQALVDALRSHAYALAARISALDDMRTRQAADLAAMPAAQAQESRLLLQVETIQRMADQLREEEQRARIAEAVEGGQIDIIDLAPLPERPINDQRSIKIAIGIILGLIIGMAAAFLRENLDTAVRTREDVEVNLQTPSLAVIPEIETTRLASRFLLPLPGRARAAIASTNGNRGSYEIISISLPNSAAAEAYRALRTNLIFSQSTNTIRNLVVTSSVAAEGKSTTAANLAVSYAQQGISVLLVDADLRRPRQHHVFQVAKTPGLTEFVLERCSLQEVLQPGPVPGLFLLTCGVQPPNPSELVGSARMRNAVKKLEDAFDLVIFDTSPVLATTESSILSARADAVLVVVKAGSTDRASVKQAIAQLRNIGAHIVGIVLNDLEGKVAKYTGYNYYATYQTTDSAV